MTQKIIFILAFLGLFKMDSNCFATNIDSLFLSKPKLKPYQIKSMEGRSFLYGIVNSPAYIRKFLFPVKTAPLALNNYFGKQKVAIKNLPVVNPNDTNQVLINIVGDIMWLRNNWSHFMDTAVQNKINKSDLLIGNLETIIDTTKGINKFWFDYRTYNSSKHLLNILPVNKSIVSVANNHSLDNGFESLKKTINLLKSRGVLSNGVKDLESKKYSLFQAKGIKVGFYASTWGVNNPKAKDQEKLNIIDGIAPYINNNLVQIHDIQLALQQMQNDGVEFKIIYMHWGYEFEFYPRENIMKLAYQIAESGANLILGSHPHVFQAAEIIPIKKNNLDSSSHVTLVNYSLGNFCTSMYSLETRLGVIETINLRRNVKGKIEFTKPEFEFVYNMPHKGTQKRKLMFLDDYIIRYPKKANQKFIKRVREIKQIFQ
jgi:poly-gamma-glutamate synthesis protein (capsule biosynthesis protein)